MPARRRLSFENYKRIRELAALGVSHVDIARALRIHDNTWRRIRKRDVAAREAYKAGRRDRHAGARLEDLIDPLPRRRPNDAAI